MEVATDIPVPIKIIREYPAASRGVVVAFTKLTYLVERDLSNCAIDITWGAWSSVTLPGHIRKYLQARTSGAPR